MPASRHTKTPHKEGKTAHKEGLTFKSALTQCGLIGGLLMASLYGGASLHAQEAYQEPYQGQDQGQAPISTRSISIDALPQSVNEQSVNDPASLSALTDERIALAIQRASAAHIDAPEAARLYMLVSIALHDGFHISKGRPGLIAEATPPQLPDSYEVMEEVSRIVIGNAFDEPYPEATLLSHYIAAQILERFPAPESETLLLSGDWIPQGAPVLPSWANSEPFFLTSAAQYRPSGPPSPGSSRYQSALDSVMIMGEDVSTARTAEQMETAQFWMDKFGTATLPGRWNFIALEQIGRQNLSLTDKLGTLLALNSALYDTGIATWDAKYHFQLARPDAIIAKSRASSLIASELRDSSLTGQDWLPMIEAPQHPEYVSAHSAFSAAAAHILTQKLSTKNLGTKNLGAQNICTRAQDIWDKARCYDDFDAAAREAGQSRIYGGIQFDFSNEDGLALGEKVAQHTLAKLKK